MNSPLSIIIAREYLERVKRKSFIITTILMPLFMVALMVVPALIAIFSSPDQERIAVIDESGALLPRLQNSAEVEFVPAALPFDSLKTDESYAGILVIGKDVLTNPSDVALHTHGPSSITMEQNISDQLKSNIESIRLQAYNIENLEEILAQVQANVTLSTYRLDREGGESSSILSSAVGMIMAFILYMIIMVYGQMVMTSIIEEKTNRVLEIVVSSVRPATLMAGKIIGVGMVAVTQILVWAVIILSFCVWGMPSLLAAVSDSEVTSILGQLGDPGYVAMLFAHMLLFLIGGYLFYSAICAAIGSAVDNIQDASQLQMVALVPIILGFVFASTVINNPVSGLAFWTSIIPFTSPLVMIARIPFGIPGWEIWLSLALLYASFIGMLWLAAKIYRVGIFMYGKKPTYRELLRWARYK